MHLMLRPLEFAQSVGELVGDHELPINAYKHDSVCQVVGDCAISTTLYEMLTD
jgi:hypothetical protein